MKKTVMLLSLFSSVSVSSAALYSMDFSVPGQGATHDDSGDALESSPVVGENWELTFGSQPSDGTTNEFITVGGVMRVQDWGSDGTVTSDEITISANGTVDITGAGLSIGSDAFNSVGTEGITWFYTINGGPAVVHYWGENELGVGNVNAGTDVGYSFADVAVLSGDKLKVGFTVNVNGADDGVEVSSLDVDFSAVPEPSSSALLGLASVAALFRRKR